MPCWTLSRGLGQTRGLGLGQDLQALLVGDRIGQPGPDQRISSRTEAQAGAQRCSAAVSHELGVLTARAVAHRHAGRLSDDVRRQLPVQHLDGRLVGQALLAHQRATDLRAPPKDRMCQPAVLEQVLVEQLGQLVDGNVFAHAHEGELEEADDHRGQRHPPRALMLQVEHQALAGHVVDDRPELLDATTRPVGKLRHRAHRRHARGKLGLLLGEQEPKDASEDRGVRCAGGHPVQALLQAAVGDIRIDGECVSHGDLHPLTRPRSQPSLAFPGPMAPCTGPLALGTSAGPGTPQPPSRLDAVDWAHPRRRAGWRGPGRASGPASGQSQRSHRRVGHRRCSDRQSPPTGIQSSSSGRHALVPTGQEPM